MLRARRGLATFEEGLPGTEADRHTFRFVFGETEGLVGIYPVSRMQLFYFCAFPASEARPSPAMCCTSDSAHHADPGTASRMCSHSGHCVHTGVCVTVSVRAQELRPCCDSKLFGTCACRPCSPSQDLPKQLDTAAKRREVLDERMGGLPHNAREIARRTRDEDLYFSSITDRCAPAGQACNATH